MGRMLLDEEIMYYQAEHIAAMKVNIAMTDVRCRNFEMHIIGNLKKVLEKAGITRT